MSTQTIIIVALVAVIGVIVAIGWRAPDRSPGVEDKTDRERIED
jgi:hypothetical protein